MLLGDKVFEGFDFNPHKIVVRPHWKDGKIYKKRLAKTACKPSDIRGSVRKLVYRACTVLSGSVVLSLLRAVQV